MSSAAVEDLLGRRSPCPSPELWSLVVQDVDGSATRAKRHSVSTIGRGRWDVTSDMTPPSVGGTVAGRAGERHGREPARLSRILQSRWTWREWLTRFVRASLSNVAGP